MKYNRRSNAYKASNLEVRMNDLTAYSYGWWRFWDAKNFTVPVFNNFPYSTTTKRHQLKTKRLLAELSYDDYLIIESPESLDKPTCIERCVTNFQSEIETLLKQIKRGRGMANQRRVERLRFLNTTLVAIKALKRKERIYIRQDASRAIGANKTNPCALKQGMPASIA